MSDLSSLEQRARSELGACGDEAALRAWHTRYFGPQGEVPDALKKIGTLPKEDRKAFGVEANRVKESLTNAHESIAARMKEQALEKSLSEHALDVTLPGRPVPRGRLHVATKILREIAAIFAD